MDLDHPKIPIFFSMRCLLANSWKGGEQRGLMDSPSFTIPHLRDQWVLFDHRDFSCSSDGPLGISRRTPSGGIGPSHGERIEKDPSKKSLGKFYRIDPWIHGCQSYLQRLFIQSIQPSTNHTSPLRWTLWDLWVYRPSDRLKKRGRNSSLRFETLF